MIEVKLRALVQLCSGTTSTGERVGESVSSRRATARWKARTNDAPESLNHEGLADIEGRLVYQHNHQHNNHETSIYLLIANIQAIFWMP